MDEGEFSVRFKPYSKRSVFDQLGTQKPQKALGCASKVKKARKIDVAFQSVQKSIKPIKQGSERTEGVHLRTESNLLRKRREISSVSQENTRSQKSVTAKPRLSALVCGSQHALLDSKRVDQYQAKRRNKGAYMKAESPYFAAVNGQILTNEYSEARKEFLPQNVHESFNSDLINGLDHTTASSSTASVRCNNAYSDTDVKDFLDWLSDWQLDVIQMKSHLLVKADMEGGFGGKMKVLSNTTFSETKGNENPYKMEQAKTEVMKVSTKIDMKGPVYRVHWKAKCNIYHHEFRAAQKRRVLQDKRLWKHRLDHNTRTNVMGETVT